MKSKVRLIDNCEYNNICFSDVVSDLKYISEQQIIILRALFDILDLLRQEQTINNEEINNK